MFLILNGATLLVALLILAAYGVYVLVNGLFHPWHLWLGVAEIMGAVLLFHLLWVEIGNLRRGPK